MVFCCASTCDVSATICACIESSSDATSEPPPAAADTAATGSVHSVGGRGASSAGGGAAPTGAFAAAGGFGGVGSGSRLRAAIAASQASLPRSSLSVSGWAGGGFHTPAARIAE